LPSEQFEIIVVDNGSVDNTGKMVYEEFASVGNVRYLHEPNVGLSHARNMGWRNAIGEYVAYLDDDAIAASTWLQTALVVFESFKPTPGCVGGKVEPLWESPRPNWLIDDLVGYLTVLDLSSAPIVLNNVQWLAGTNMSFPRSLLESMGGFRTDLGRKGRRLLSMEEVALQRKLQSEGYSCVYHPEIKVIHHIPSSRLNQNWFLRRVYWQGASEAVIAREDQKLSFRNRLRIARDMLSRSFRCKRELACLIRFTNDPERFSKQCFLWRELGYVLGLSGLAR
jgi:GT2 family glycosyltransferase